MILEKAKENLLKRGINAIVFDDKEDLIDYIMKITSDKKSIGIGGSITIDELGLYEKFLKNSKEIFWHWKVEPEGRLEILKKASISDIYFSSSNALVEDGRIVNIDGVGNRVSSMIFGPKKVIVIVGKNKIVKDLDSAIKRIKEDVCPLNAKRLNRETPCNITGKCNECRGENRMCNVTTIIEGVLPTVNMEVFIVNEKLGY